MNDADQSAPSAASAAALPQPAPPRALTAAERSARGAFLVAAGILLSRIMGLVRTLVFAHYFGNSAAAGVFQAALRIPNFLQNLFGEGVLSASFIPVYAGLVGRGERDEADRVAGAVFGLLSLLVSVVVVGGMAASPILVRAIAPGLEGPDHELGVSLVRIFFPGIGLLVLSAWCLGILNSHRKFFLSYTAPVVWNVAIIAALWIFGEAVGLERLATYVAYGAVVGSVLQLGVQIPNTMALLGRFRPALTVAAAPVRQVIRGFVPVVASRGVVWVSAMIDTHFASLISAGVLAALSYAQMLYLLPVSLFGMAISAAELPEMSQAEGQGGEWAAGLRERIGTALPRVAFFVIPSAAAFLFLGDVVAGIFESGRFTASDSRFLWFLLMAAAVGLLASTLGRVYSSAFYALKDTRTPLYFATARVVVAAGLAAYAVLGMPAHFGVPPLLAAVGINAASGVAAWVEYLLLRRALAKRIGDVGLGGGRLAVLMAAAAAAGLLGIGVKVGLSAVLGANASVISEWSGSFLLPPKLDAKVTAVLVLGAYGVTYFALTSWLGVPQAITTVRRVTAPLRKLAGHKP